MTFNYKNVYVGDTVTVAGVYEKNGPLKKYFDKTYNDLYFGEDSWEKAEIKAIKDNLALMSKKLGKQNSKVDLVIGADLLNQISASTYGCLGYGEAFIGVYGACSSSVLEMIIASNFIDSGQIENAIALVSSHNMTSEKQFRNPTEYGGVPLPCLGGWGLSPRPRGNAGEPHRRTAERGRGGLRGAGH